MTDRALRLAIVMPTFFEQMVGGSEYQAYLLAERAKAAGMDVHYAFMDSGAELSNRLGIGLHPLRRIKMRKSFGAIWSLFYNRVMAAIREIDPDVLYVRGGCSWAAMTASYATKNGRKSVWHVAHLNNVTPVPVWKNWRRPFDILERWSIDYAIRHSDVVVCHARHQARALKKHFGRDSEVILKEQPEPTETIDKSGPFTVAWVANIKAWKQPEMFVRLARELQDCESARFVMIGRPAGGRYQEELEAEIARTPNLTYPGGLPIEEVNRILAESHVFVNTSTSEGLPNTFVQAWMREVPVVGMVWDPDDILKPGKVGFLSGSFEQMVKDVQKLIENPELRDEMGRLAREYALEHHLLKKNMGRLLDLMMG